jgi:hypothetical protein
MNKQNISNDNEAKLNWYKNALKADPDFKNLSEDDLEEAARSIIEAFQMLEEDLKKRV